MCELIVLVKMSYPSNLSPVLSKILNKSFDKVGNLPLYRSDDELVIARWSRKYEDESIEYWYGLKARDFRLVNEHPVTHFGYVCAYDGVLMLPKEIVLNSVSKNKLNKSLNKYGELIHYHIRLSKKDGQMKWVQSEGRVENVHSYYHYKL